MTTWIMKITQSCKKILGFSGLAHQGMKTIIFFLLQTNGKHSPLFLLKQETFLQFSVVQFLAATNGESSGRSRLLTSNHQLPLLACMLVLAI
jgi:NADH:ubiquinone oxidoreductase subunit 2 (subunit N)